MKIALINSKIIDYDIQQNISFTKNIINTVSDDVSWIILPEMFLTGFVFDDKLAQQSMIEGLKLMRQISKQRNCAVEGTLLIQENNKLYNRHYFITPNKEVFYDKKHLFSLSDEAKYLTAGRKHTIVDFYNWNIQLLTCYDLRFPLWSVNKRNKGHFLYDILVYCACWPESRIEQWKSLLKARAIENQCFVIGVNRQGYDSFSNHYPISTYLFNAKAQQENALPQSDDIVQYYDIDKQHLTFLREKFPVSLDW